MLIQEEWFSSVSASGIEEYVQGGHKAQSDCALFSRLYIANQNPDGDLDEFFKYENFRFPPSLFEYGKMRFCKKSDLLVCLEPQDHH